MTILERLIILILAGGDASRYLIPLHGVSYLPSVSENLRAPLAVRKFSQATDRVFTDKSVTFIDLILGFIRGLEKENHLQIPVAVVTGPNNHYTIINHLKQSGNLTGSNIHIIQQNSKPVFTQDGRPIFWEDGSPMEAPDGTAGCLDALRRSDWFKVLADNGYEKIFAWYVNDPVSGTNLIDFLDSFDKGGTPFLWFSDDLGQKAYLELNQPSPDKHDPVLVSALEDSAGAWVFKTECLDEVLGLVEEHPVLKKVPVMRPDGGFTEALKRERFLTDALRKAYLLETINLRSAITDKRQGDELLDQYQITNVVTTNDSPVFEFIDIETGGPFSLDRTEKVLEGRGIEAGKNLIEHMSQSVKEGVTKFVVSTDIGEKNIGEYLVDAYQVIEVKHGTFGLVYICTDQATGERAAVKTYTDEIRWSQPSAVQRFWQEANQWAALPAHPHIVGAEQVVEIDGRLHIFMEYMDDDLRTILTKRIPSIVETIEIILQICSGLQAIHAVDIVHRDIKPENILVNKNRTAKISDLGLAAIITDGGPSEIAGTRGYWSPEQVVSPEDISTAADIFSLGVVLFEMLTGVLPSDGRGSLVEMNPQVTTSLSRLVQTCLSFEAGMRPTAGELLTALAREYRAYTGKDNNVLLTPASKTGPPQLGRINSLAALGRHCEAFMLCEDRLKIQPDDRRAHYTRALLLYDLHHFSESIAECFLIQAMPGGPGEELKDRLDTLIDMCCVWLGVSKHSSLYWVTMGVQAAYSLGANTLGLKFVELALYVDSNCQDAWLLKGQCLYNLGRYSEAISCLKTAEQGEDSQLSRLAFNYQRLSQLILDRKALPQFRFEQLIARGNHHFGNGEYRQAEQCFRQALDLYPERTDAQMRLGACLLELGRSEDALDSFEKILSVASQDVLTLYNKGVALDVLGRSGEALACYDQVISLSPDHISAWNNRGACLLVLEQYSEAKQCFEKVLQLDPDREKARKGLEMIDARLHGFSTQKQIQENSDYWSDKGVRLIDQGDLRSALNCFRTAINIAPQSAIVWYNAGYTLWCLSQYNAALEHCDRALALDPGLVHAWNIRGNALDDLGRTQEALDSYDQAIKLDGQYYEAWNGKGLCLDALGKYQNALECFEKACEIKMDFARGWYNQAGTLSVMGLHEKAIHCYDRALEINPHHPKATLGKGRELFLLGRYNEAEKVFHLSVETAPQDYETWTNLGAAQAMLGKVGDAMISYKRALAIQPRYELARRNLDRLKQLSAGNL